MLAPFNLPKGKAILVSDELAAPADFLLYQAVNGQLKDADKPTSKSDPSGSLALVLSTSVDMGRWKTTSLKYVGNDLWMMCMTP